MKIAYLEDETHKSLKVEAAKADRTMQELVEEVLGGWLSEHTGNQKDRADR